MQRLKGRRIYNHQCMDSSIFSNSQQISSSRWHKHSSMQTCSRRQDKRPSRSHSWMQQPRRGCLMGGQHIELLTATCSITTTSQVSPGGTGLPVDGHAQQRPRDNL
mmetsp:Transcript_40498/g.60359  ORF Transcript_40498/g.60359 Transcript_40498/m.60359 type:complete len:106 (+) Transcript_40498:49-366(+)